MLVYTQSQAPAGPPETESGPGCPIDGFAGNHFSDPQTGGQHRGGCQKSHKGSDPNAESQPAHLTDSRFQDAVRMKCRL